MVRKNLRDLQEGRPLGLGAVALVFMACGSLASSICAQDSKMAITPEPVGSGARALGQSAFIAVADDATAASWNPAGLINLERPEASFVGAWRTTTKDYSVAVPAASLDRDRWSAAEINFMSYAQPIQIGNTDAVLSVNYHQVYDFGVEFNGLVPLDGVGLIGVAGESEGAVAAYTLAGGLSIPCCPELTVGASFNWYGQSLLNDYAWRVKSTGSLWLGSAPPAPPNQIIGNTDTFSDFRGHNFTVGLLWDACEKQERLLTLGLVCHTPFTAEVDRELVATVQAGPTEPITTVLPRERMDIDFPLSLGAGANYRFSDTFSVAFDVEWKEWSEFRQKYADGTLTSPIDDDIWVYRLGAEHLFISTVRQSVLALRCGGFYEPRPSANDPDTLSIYGFSLGLGCTVKERFSLDLAYQFRWGEQDLGALDYDIQEHFLVSSLITYF